MNKYFKTALISLFIFSLFNCWQTTAAAKPQAPEVKIRVAQYADSLDFILPAGGRWLTSKRSGSIPAGVKCSVSGKMNKPAVKKFHIMVGSAPIADKAKLKKIHEKFFIKGFNTFEFMIGREPEKGFPDNRKIFIGVKTWYTLEDAEKNLDQLADQNISAWIFTETIQAAKGRITLKIAGKIVPFNFNEIKLEGKSGVKLLKAEYARDYSWHGFADRTYKSTIQIKWGADDCLDCIEHTNLESLLVGIVPSEISAKAPAAALQAQAIAARGEMLSKLGTRHHNTGYDFCSEQHCQVYKGKQSCDDHIFNSIKNTWGQILLDHKNKALDAVYSANCGGHTSANHNIWTSNPNPHLQGVFDTVKKQRLNLKDEEQVEKFILNPPECWCGFEGIEGSSKFRWIKKINAANWKKIEKKIDLGKIKEINLFERDVSGRIISLKATGEKGSKRIMKELKIRRIFNNLKSSCFIVEFNKDSKGFIKSATFKGAGWGHGVGMCQTGAQSMATKGRTFKQILLHYFPGANIRKLY
ncbi:MAG: SpoIID/LytB domain-containing protein [Candidatus Rifleibacteriota bacterium]